jgi:chemotaxis protein CheC
MTLTLTEAGHHAVAGTFSRAMARAGEALGAMSGNPVQVQTPQLRRCTADQVLVMAGGPEAVVLAVYVGITGSLRGHALLLFSPEDAHRLAGILLAGLLGPGELPMDISDDPLFYDELEMSALQEAGNVTISAFLNELGMHLHEPVMPTPPQVVVEMAGAVLDAVLLDLVADGNQVLAAKTTFSEGGLAIDGALFVLPRAESLQVLLDALGALGI